MAFLADTVFDSGLNQIDTLTENLYITSQEATTFTEAATTYKLGTKATPTIAAPADRGGGGREVVISSISDGSVGADGTASHWALTDDSGSLLLATGALSSTQAVTNGNTFTLTSFAIGVADPT